MWGKVVNKTFNGLEKGWKKPVITRSNNRKTRENGMIWWRSETLKSAVKELVEQSCGVNWVVTWPIGLKRHYTHQGWSRTKAKCQSKSPFVYNVNFKQNSEVHKWKLKSECKHSFFSRSVKSFDIKVKTDCLLLITLELLKGFNQEVNVSGGCGAL